MSETTEKKVNTGKGVDIPVRARRKLDARTIAAVARGVSEQLTESESCRLLGIEPATWFNFKRRGKNDSRFAAKLEKFTAKRNEMLLGLVKKSATGEGMKQRDWRAGAWLLSTAEPKRFSDAAARVQIEVTAPLPPVPPETLKKALQIAVLEFQKEKQAQAIDVPATVKEIGNGEKGV